MATEIITIDDLRIFKLELITELKEIIQSQNHYSPKKWLKSYQVKELLSISSGTLQNLRINGTIPYSKIGGVILYEYNEIEKLIESNKSTTRFKHG